MSCARAGCTNAARYFPVLSFAAKVAPCGPRVEMRLPLPLCEAHADPNPATYVTDAGWQQIEIGMAAAGYAAPDRSTVDVWFEAVQ